jgi:secondary thiamine-phosphate synthase enzyme
VLQIHVQSDRRTQLIDVTAQVREVVSAALEDAAAVLVFAPHTTAGVTINEHADPAVAGDLEAALGRMVGDDWGWQHVEAGEENAPSHVRTSLMGPQVIVPVVDGKLALGTWQGIFLCEFDGPRRRSLFVTPLA